MPATRAPVHNQHRRTFAGDVVLDRTARGLGDLLNKLFACPA